MPKSVASRLTVPITVTPFNIQELKDLVAKSIGGGPPEWPGAMVSFQCTSLILLLRLRGSLLFNNAALLATIIGLID